MKKEENAIEKARKTFSEFLKGRHCRKTPERYAVLEHIYQSDGRFSANSLFCDMQGDHKVSRATVYNTLELLLQCGLIIKHQTAQQQAYYEKVASDRTHHHLVCTECGKVKKFSDKYMRNVIQSRRFAYFEPGFYSLYVYGLCNKCKQKRRMKKNEGR